MVNWWDQVYITLQVAFPNFWGILPEFGSDAYDLAQSTMLVIGGYIGGFMAVILYFPISALNVVITLLNQIIGSLSGVMNSVISLGNTFSGLITNTFTDVFPNQWLAILSTIVLLNVALRVYYFAKDIEILGFKI